MSVIDVRDKAALSLAMGLSQLKHIRFHRQEEVGPKAKKALDKYIPLLQGMVETLSDVDLSK